MMINYFAIMNEANDIRNALAKAELCIDGLNTGEVKNEKVSAHSLRSYAVLMKNAAERMILELEGKK